MLRIWSVCHDIVQVFIEVWSKPNFFFAKYMHVVIVFFLSTSALLSQGRGNHSRVEACPLPALEKLWRHSFVEKILQTDFCSSRWKMPAGDHRNTVLLDTPGKAFLATPLARAGGRGLRHRSLYTATLFCRHCLHRSYTQAHLHSGRQDWNAFCQKLRH